MGFAKYKTCNEITICTSVVLLAPPCTQTWNGWNGEPSIQFSLVTFATSSGSKNMAFYVYSLFDVILSQILICLKDTMIYSWKCSTSQQYYNVVKMPHKSWFETK